MRVVMHLPVQARMEWKAAGGLQGVTIEDTTDREANFFVYTSAADDEPLEGTASQVVRQAENLVEQKKIGAAFVTSLMDTIDQMVRQPIPTATFGHVELLREREAIRERRRDWLLREIENGNYAAITMLKEEFGEDVKITVEVV